MIALALLALMSSGPSTVSAPASARAGGLRPPLPIANPATWVTTEDYPSVALRAEAQGTVAFRLTVSPMGEPVDCAVQASSGNQTLDDTTCRLLMLRARFSPALDDRARPVVGLYSNKVRWTIPQGDRPLEPGSVVRSYDILIDGTMANCRVEAVSGAMASGFSVGLVPCASGVQFERPFNAAGKPVIKHVSETVELRIAGDDAGK